MKKVITVFLICTFCLFTLLVVRTYSSSKAPEKLSIPDIDSFSDAKLEQHENKLPELDKAILYINGNKQEISKDDKRLIRLLNFCTYAEDSGMSMWTVSIDYNSDKKEIETGDRLEIFFKDVESTNIGWDFIMYDRFVIKGNAVWLIQSKPQYELFHEGNTIGASVWYPYAGRCEGSENLDFLVESGFSKK